MEVDIRLIPKNIEYMEGEVQKSIQLSPPSLHTGTISQSGLDVVHINPRQHGNSINYAEGMSPIIQCEKRRDDCS